MEIFNFISLRVRLVADDGTSAFSPLASIQMAISDLFTCTLRSLHFISVPRRYSKIHFISLSLSHNLKKEMPCVAHANVT